MSLSAVVTYDVLTSHPFNDKSGQHRENYPLADESYSTKVLTMPSLFRKMDTRHLRGSDTKKIVRVLRNSSHSAVDSEGDDHNKAIKAAIKKLPRRLRSSPLLSHETLCRIHRGLDAHLVDDIWAWIKHELEVGIGRFLYPIIMSKVLPEPNASRVRQLEPVVEMFNPHWTLAESPPPGIPPIDAQGKWKYQENRCPACMLARIGSDRGALFALFACMYGHVRSRSGGQKGVDKIKSKRLRFVRYWVRTHPQGEQATFDAYDLGMELRALRHKAKAVLRTSRQPTHYTRDSLIDTPTTTRHCLDDEPVTLEPTRPTIIEGLNTEKPLPQLPRATIHIQPPTPKSTTPTHSIHSTHTTEEDSLPPLPVLSRTNLKRRDSVLSISRPDMSSLHPLSSIHSSASRLTLATSIASFNDPVARSRTPRYDPFDTPEERMEKYRKMLARNSFECSTDISEGTVGEGMVGDWAHLLPKPSRMSIYSAFAEEGWDGAEFDEVDDSLLLTPGLGGAWEGDEEDDNEGDTDFDLDALRLEDRD